MKKTMALAPIFGCRGSPFYIPDYIDYIPDPFETVLTLSDKSQAGSTPASSFASDDFAVASTSVDWKETSAEHIFKADLPGLKKEEIQVQIEDGRTLSISGQRSKEELQKSDTWHRVERSCGQFLRKFRLPDNVELDRIAAKVENGVLTVTVPKVEAKAAQPRTIEVDGDNPCADHVVPNLRGKI